ncbi:hypothetical protein [Collimonas sp.]|jgi:hypothetical protein|uniref:hypothetical protein n=1 Tax=Collimonas sp. TaxID=1963772 RepID=UPI0037C1296A
MSIYLNIYLNIYRVYASRRQMPAILRLMLNFLAEKSAQIRTGKTARLNDAWRTA